MGNVELLAEYFYSNYISRKASLGDDFYLATSDGFQRVSHCMSFVMVAFNALGIYCILRHSPVRMGHAKWHLLNLQLWSMTMDLMFTVMVTPMLFLPTIGGISLGLLQSIGVPIGIQIYVGFGCVGAMAMAILALFEHRHRSILPASHPLRFRDGSPIRYALIGVHFVFTCNIIVPELLTMPKDQVAAKIASLQNVPMPPPEFFTEDAIVLQEDGFLLGLIVSVALGIVAVEIVFFGVHSAWSLLAGGQSFMSSRTRKLHTAFLWATVMQAAIPLTVLIVPILYLLLALRYSYYNQALNNLAIVWMTFHGLAGTLSLVLLNAPYRRAISRMFLGRKQSNNSSAVGKSTVVL